MNYWKQSEKNIYVAAHRGLSWRFPENTLPAFQAALACKPDQIEFDVRVTKDGELVVIHDSTVDRTTDGTGRVDEFTLSELQKLCAGVKFDVDCCIPTLRETLALMATDPTMTLDVELKEYPTPGREALAYDVCDRALAMVDEFGFTDRCVINSFSGKILEYIVDKYGKKYRTHAYYPKTRMQTVSKGTEGDRDPADYAYCICIAKDTGPEIYDLMRQKGVEPWYYTALLDEEITEHLIRNRVTLITCNNPEVALTLLRRRGYHE